MLDQFVISSLQHALAMDSLISSHPINSSVEDPNEIEASFDMISYKKVRTYGVQVFAEMILFLFLSTGILLDQNDRKLSGNRQSPLGTGKVLDSLQVQHSSH